MKKHAHGASTGQLTAVWYGGVGSRTSCRGGRAPQQPEPVVEKVCSVSDQRRVVGIRIE